MKFKDKGVTVEAHYEVGEYDIIILSATKSKGLEEWLNINGYNIPKGASDVLQPYIKSDMKFFVVKVNLARLESGASTRLNPIQITYNSPKHMLPIRLGMANSNGNQDMIVYLFSQTGRIETSNYRNVKVPTGL